jgi:hypothetical protein
MKGTLLDLIELFPSVPFFLCKVATCAADPPALNDKRDLSLPLSGLSALLDAVDAQFRHLYTHEDAAPKLVSLCVCECV